MNKEQAEQLLTALQEAGAYLIINNINNTYEITIPINNEFRDLDEDPGLELDVEEIKDEEWEEYNEELDEGDPNDEALEDEGNWEDNT